MIVVVSRCLSATGVRFWNRPAPAGGLGLPYGRLTAVTRGPRRGCHVAHEGDTTGSDALYTPQTAVSSRREHLSTPAPAAISAAVCSPRYHIPSAGFIVTRHHQGFTPFVLSVFPFTCGPRMERAPLGLTT